MIVANLHDFPEDWLPLFAQRAYPATDIASYPNLFDALESVMRLCMESTKMQRSLGWAIGGLRRAIGEPHFHARTKGLVGGSLIVRLL